MGDLRDWALDTHLAVAEVIGVTLIFIFVPDVQFLCLFKQVIRKAVQETVEPSIALCRPGYHHGIDIRAINLQIVVTCHTKKIAEFKKKTNK